MWNVVESRGWWVVVFLITVFCTSTQSKFYIYPWPSALDDVYPHPNTTLHKESTYSHQFYPNDGIGEFIEPDIGLFQTWQFALYKNIMQRLRTSKHRTFNPDEATAFIIPFDCGVHSYIDHVNGKKRLASPHGWVAKMFLENSPYMKRYHGHDHFVIFSITLYQMIGIGVKMFYQDVCFNCTSLVIESSPAFLTPLSGWPYKNYWYAVPYTSSFHWWEGIKTLPWSTVQDHPRDIFVLFIGSIRTATVAANKFRKLLYEQCLAVQNTSHVLHRTTEAASSDIRSWCQWHTVSHACNALTDDISRSLLPLYRRSIFCPAPVGDSLTRKSLFDALLAGCIPVIFDRRSLSQYHWHLPPSLLDQVAIILDKDEVVAFTTSQSPQITAVSFVELLRNRVSPARIASMQAAIAQHASLWQYALVPASVRLNMRAFEASLYVIPTNVQENEGTTSSTKKQVTKDLQTLAHVQHFLETARSFDATRHDMSALQWEPATPDAVSVIIEHILHPKTVSPAEGNATVWSLYDNNKDVSTLRPLSPEWLVAVQPTHMNRSYVRHFCRDDALVVQDGVFHSRGLAWHRLRQVCLAVDLLIHLQDGRVVDVSNQSDSKPMKRSSMKDKKKKKPNLPK